MVEQSFTVNGLISVLQEIVRDCYPARNFTVFVSAREGKGGPLFVGKVRQLIAEEDNQRVLIDFGNS